MCLPFEFKEPPNFGRFIFMALQCNIVQQESPPCFRLCYIGKDIQVVTV
jgi:hypothetical protein